ncbi:MAG: helix-turn-helix domain-containing protein [Oscillospiraceae bacterium]|jgi:transcriptional regulator with XRE-family HTH domain|nr:helix-turn-helix domain-containing protein [Oscillospiraceae bacterium]
MNISEKLRRMRRDRDLTQEDLADAFGVTYQAVSKWERGESFPDITLLPAIARYFGVTVDALLDDEDERRRKVAEISGEHRKICMEQNSDAAAEYLKTALCEFPDGWELWINYAQYRGGSIRVNCNRPIEEPEGLRDAIEVCNRLLRHCVDDRLRHRANLILAESCKLLGDNDAALKIILELPGIADVTREVMLPYFLSGEGRVTAIQSVFMNVADTFWSISRFVAHPDTFTYADDASGEHFGYTPEERIAILEKSVAVSDILTDGGEAYQPWHQSYQYRNMAYIAAEDGQYERAAGYLEKAADYAVANDAVVTGAPYRSPLLNRLTQVRANECSGDLANFVNTQTVFDALRGTPRAAAVLARLG